MRFSLVTIVMCIASSAAFAGDSNLARNMGVKWIFGEEAAAAQSVPDHMWLEDGALLLYDAHEPEATRQFERLDVKSGKRRRAFDMQAAVRSLRSLIGATAPNVLPWPDALDRKGEWALYSLDGTLFLLDLTAAEFTRLTGSTDDDNGARFSPDGKKIAFVRQNNIWIYDLNRHTEHAITHDGSEVVLNGRLSFEYGEDIFSGDGFGIWWSPDSSAVAFLRTDVSGVGVIQYSTIFPYHPEVQSQYYPVAGEPIEVVRVGLAEVESGATRWAERTGIVDQYVVHVDWLPDSRRVSIQTLNRKQDTLDMYFVERSSGRACHVLTEHDSAWVNVSDDLYFLKNSKHFIWGSERDGHKHLYLYDLNGRLIRQITKGEWSVRGPNQVTYWWGQSVVAIDERSSAVYFTSLEKSSLERHLYRIGLDGSGMRRISSEAGFHSVEFSPNGRNYLDKYSRASTLPSLSVRSSDGKHPLVVAPARAASIAGFDMQYPEFLTVPAVNGSPMPAQLIRPRHFDPTHRYPVIVHHYGGPQAPLVVDRWQAATFYNQVLADRGYVVFSFDNRSATAKSKTSENLLLGQVFGANELQDLQSAMQWLKSQSWVDDSRIGIWGWSYGGGFTLMGMTRTEDFKAGIAVGAPTDNRFSEAKWAEFAMKRPQDNGSAYDAVSFLTRAKNLHGSLMLAHGTHDDNVRLQNTWRFIDALIAADMPFDLAIYPMRKHLIADRAARVHLFEKMTEFWDKNL